MLGTCRVCTSTDNLKMCSRCHTVAYCSSDHQKQDWKDHKMNCKQSFHSYDQPVISSDGISNRQMIEIIGGPITGDFYVRERDNIYGTIFRYSDLPNKCVLSKDLIFLPLCLPEIDSEMVVPPSQDEWCFYYKDSVVPTKTKSMTAVDLIVQQKSCKSFQFLSWTLDSPQMMQAVFDFVLNELKLPAKAQIRLYSNSEVLSSILGSLLLGQIWRCYNIKPLEIEKLENTPNHLEVSRNLITFCLA